MDMNDIEPYLNGMYDHFETKYGFKKPPTMIFDTDPSNQSKVLGKTAYYDPQSLEIHVFVDGRHPKDILRSIAHELIHHMQNLEGRLDTDGYSGPGYYLENDTLKEVEHEAMLEGNATMREYEDTVKYKEKDTMSLKEWKNSELNKLMLKKFGILSESKNKKPDADGDGIPDWADKENGEEESEEELDEGRNNPRTTNSDKFVGHEDRYQDDRIHEEDDKDVDDKKKKHLMNPNEFDNKAGSAKQVKKGADDDRNPPPKSAALQEAVRKIANAKKVFLKGKRIK